MALSVTCNVDSNLPIDFSGLTPEWAQGKSLTEIENHRVLIGHHRVPLADFCKLSGDASDGRLELVGDFSHAHGIGAGMTSGLLSLVGNAGNHVGQRMRGGEIHITGDVHDSLGCEQRGGIIRVDGSAGNAIGGSLAGSPRGMTGGTILIAGDVGVQTGKQMRRGLIAVAGSAGELVGHNMLAGTIVVLGACGGSSGAGMKRGTLYLLSDTRPPLLPTFRSAGITNSPISSLLGRNLESLGFKGSAERFKQPLELLHGDFLSSGKGELFLSN